MKKTFKYSEPDTLSFFMTVFYILLAAGIATGIWLLFDWPLYTRVLLSALLVAILMLYILSIPGRIEVTDSYIDIHCTVELTRISVQNIRSVRKLERSDMKREFPILGSFGLFGYFGYYLNLRTFRISTLYCTTWSDFVEITDIYEKRYVISTPRPDAFIAAVTSAIEG